MVNKNKNNSLLAIKIIQLNCLGNSLRRNWAKVMSSDAYFRSPWIGPRWAYRYLKRSLSNMPTGWLVNLQTYLVFWQASWNPAISFLHLFTTTVDGCIRTQNNTLQQARLIFSIVRPESFEKPVPQRVCKLVSYFYNHSNDNQHC